MYLEVGHTKSRAPSDEMHTLREGMEESHVRIQQEGQL